MELDWETQRELDAFRKLLKFTFVACQNSSLHSALQPFKIFESIVEGEDSGSERNLTEQDINSLTFSKKPSASAACIQFWPEGLPIILANISVYGAKHKVCETVKTGRRDQNGEEITEYFEREEIEADAYEEALAGLQSRADFFGKLGFMTALDEGDHGLGANRSDRWPNLWICCATALPATPTGHRTELTTITASLSDIDDLLSHDFKGFRLSFIDLNTSPPFRDRILWRLFPRDSNPIELASKHLVPAERLAAAAENLKRCGGNLNLVQYSPWWRKEIQKPEKLRFLVEGLIPYGTISLLVGEGGSGKSTLAHELAIAAAEGPIDDWLGRKVDRNRNGNVVLLSGEDDSSMLAAREDHFLGGNEAEWLVHFPSSGQDMRTLVAQLREYPKLKLVIVDPAVKFIDGDEDSSDNVGRFLDELSDLAASKGCAVLIIHHLRKASNARTIEKLREAIRGSGVFVDRPRIVLGMIRRRHTASSSFPDNTVIGVVKHNMPPSVHIPAAKEYCRDEASLRHVPLNKAETRSLDTTDEIAELIFRCAAQHIQAGRRITRTGKYELFQIDEPKLQGIGRKRIRDNVKAFVQSGRLYAKSDGALAVPDDGIANKDVDGQPESFPATANALPVSET